MRVTPTRRRRRGNGTVKSWTSEGDESQLPVDEMDVPTVVLPAHVAAVATDAAPGASPERDRPAQAAAPVAVSASSLAEMQSADTVLAATELLQRIDRLQAEMERPGTGENGHVVHDYRTACADLIKQYPWLALSKDVDQRLWGSWQRELAALEGHLATSTSGDGEMKLRDALYVALRNYSALIQEVQAAARAPSATTPAGTTDATTPQLLHRLSLAHAHVMYALEIHTAGQDGKKNWRMPELYYERARRWYVTQGETHYHLARIVLHDNRCAEALYHLVRSRIAATPFDSPGSLADQFAHVSGLRESASSDATVDEATSWLRLDRTVLSVIAPYFGQQQEFMAHRRAPQELMTAFCGVLDTVCGDSVAAGSDDDRDKAIAGASIQLVRLACLLIACACLQSDLVQNSAAVPAAAVDVVSVKNPRAIELLASVVNALLHRVLAAITSPLRTVRQKEQALQLMLPAVNVAFAWLVRIEWRRMVAEATRASCEQLSTMVLTGIIAGGFLAPHEDITSTSAPTTATPPLEEEAEVVGLACYDWILTAAEENLAATQDGATERELLQRRIVKFLSFVEAFMTPRPAAAAVIASAAPSASTLEGRTDHVAGQLEQLSVATSASSPPTASSGIERVSTAEAQRDSVSLNVTGVRELWTPATMTTSTRSTSKSKARNNTKAPPVATNASLTTPVTAPATAPAAAASSERVVVLDAANIAMRHGLQRRFSCRGIQLCAEYFIAQGDRVVAFLPDYCLDVDADGSFRRRVAVAGGGGGRGRRREGRFTITPDDRVLLEILVDSGVVVLTPAMDSDDLYCIHYAKRHNAFLVTNDLFRDHISDTDGPKARQTELRNWLQTRRISYTFVADEFLPNPNSAYEKARSLAGAPPPPAATAS